MIVGLGSNLDPEVNLLRGLAALFSAFDVTAVSSVYVTEPIGEGYAETGDFFNSCVAIRWDVSLDALKSKLITIEASIGRRREIGAAARPIDLDILAAADDAGQVTWVPNAAMPAFVEAITELGIDELVVPTRNLIPESPLGRRVIWQRVSRP